MYTHIIAFEVKNEERKKKLKDKIRSFDYYCIITDSCCAIKSNYKVVELRDQFNDILEKSDKIFVLQSGHYAAWKGVYDKDVAEWLKEYL